MKRSISYILSIVFMFQSVLVTSVSASSKKQQLKFNQVTDKKVYEVGVEIRDSLNSQILEHKAMSLAQIKLDMREKLRTNIGKIQDMRIKDLISIKEMTSLIKKADKSARKLLKLRTKKKIISTQERTLKRLELAVEKLGTELAYAKLDDSKEGRKIASLKNSSKFILAAIGITIVGILSIANPLLPLMVLALYVVTDQTYLRITARN